MLTLTEVWAHLNRRHTQNFSSYRPTKSHYRVEKHIELLDIIYTQMQHRTGKSPGSGNVLLKLAGGDVQRGHFRLSVRPPHACFVTKQKKLTAKILIPHERIINLVFYRNRLVGYVPFHL